MLKMDCSKSSKCIPVFIPQKARKMHGKIGPGAWLKDSPNTGTIFICPMKASDVTKEVQFKAIPIFIQNEKSARFGYEEITPGYPKIAG